MEASPPVDDRETRPRVVVGIDGSPGSHEALRVAWEEARRRHGVLEVVHAWSLPPFVVAFAPTAPLPPVVYRDAEDAARAVVAEAVAELPHDPAVTVVPVVVDGTASRVLDSVAEGADLLVVGRRGHSRFTELFMGSTSRACVEHAPCPVLVVPPPAHVPAAGSEAGRGSRHGSPLEAGSS